MIHVGEGKERVQSSVDRGRYSSLAKRRQRIVANHFIFVLFAAVELLELLQTIHIQQSKPGIRDGAEIAPTAFNGQYSHRTSGKRIGKLELGAGVATPEICDAQIRAQQIRTIAQQSQLIAG